MQVNGRLKWIALGAVLLLGTGLAIALAGVKVPEFAGIREFKFGEIVDDELHAEVEVALYNPGWFRIGGRNLDYMMSYRDTVIGSGKLPDGFSLPAGDTTYTNLPVDLHLDALSKVHKSMLSSQQKDRGITLDLEGEFGFINKHMQVRMPIDMKPKALMGDVIRSAFGNAETAIHDISWKSIDLKSSEFSFKISIPNPLDAPLTLKSGHLELEDEDGQPAGNWKLSEPVSIPGKEEKEIPCSIQINHVSAIKESIPTVLRGKIRNRAKGELRFELSGFDFDMPLEGHLTYDILKSKGDFEPATN